jgi:adenine C2-methylase RlmN of 23S rRNA A2503 and tRNA A37
MTDLPAAWRVEAWISSQKLDGWKSLGRRMIRETDHEKFLFDLSDGLRVESVYLPESPGETACISSQVGCALGCHFCATAKMGLFRNLTIAEILLQVLEVERQCDTRLTNLVFMGMGEPLHNYDNVVAALKLLTDPEGIGLSRPPHHGFHRGLVSGIERWMRKSAREAWPSRYMPRPTNAARRTDAD